MVEESPEKVRECHFYDRIWLEKKSLELEIEWAKSGSLSLLANLMFVYAAYFDEKVVNPKWLFIDTKQFNDTSLLTSRASSGAKSHLKLCC